MTAADLVLNQWLEEELQVRSRLKPPGVVTRDQAVSLSGQEFFDKIFAGELPSIWIGSTMQFVPIRINKDEAIFQGEPLEQFLNPLGTTHGGWFCTLLDSALGCAIHANLPAGKSYTTLELKVNMIRALGPKVPRVRAIGKVIHLGGQVATSEAKLVGHDGKLYGHATTTGLLFDVQANGR